MVNIAIDGVGGSGKSTLARGLAKRLGYRVLDTGAIYRGLACEYKAQGYGKPTEKIISKFIKDIKVELFFEGELQHVVVNGTDYTARLRSEEISTLSSIISPFDNLRQKVRDLQRDFAKKYNCVIEGRDIGRVVIPNADLKLFVTAKPEIRAQRRFDQIKDKPNAPTFEAVLEELNRRDYADIHREVAALVPADDAIILDTSFMTLEQSIDKCEELVNERIKA